MSDLAELKKAKLLLAIHLSFCAVVIFGTYLFMRLGLHFPPCAFHKATGYYCITCGCTRSSLALLKLQFVKSFLLNPFPILLSAFTLAVLGFECYSVLVQKRVRFQWFIPCIWIIFSVCAVYMLLRNCGIVPIPNQIHF